MRRNGQSSKATSAPTILMLLAAIRGGVNSLMAEILEDYIHLHILHPDRGGESLED